MRKVIVIASAVIGLMLVGCSNDAADVSDSIEPIENDVVVEAEDEKEERNINIVVATDLHFISPELTDYGTSFMTTIENGDGKVMRYTDELTDAFFGEVIEMQPDALIISGDTTFNGAKQSHIDLASKIKKVEENNIPVLVMSGNHDLGLYRSAKFTGDTFEDVPSISADEFYKIYDVSTYRDAVRKDTSSYSYAYEVQPSLWVLMLDVNGVDKANSISKKTYEWVEETLKYAYNNDIDVLAVSHQNVLVHNDMITNGFVISNVDELKELYRKYNVITNLSGHIHMQNIKTDNDVTEIVTSALSIQPNQYGVINIVGDEFEYNVKKTDVEAWAVANNSTDENLLNFSEYAKDFFVGAENNLTTETLNKSGATESEKTEMMKFFNSSNIDYFAGVIDSSLVDSNGMKLWEKYGEGTFIYPYMQSMFRDNEGSDVYIKLNIGGNNMGNKITIINDKYEMGDSGELVNVNNIIIDSSLKKMLDIINHNEGYADYRECVNNLLLIGINEVYGDFGDGEILSVGEKFEMSNTLEVVDGVTIVINGKLKEVMDIEMEKNSEFKTYAHVTQDLMLKGIKHYVDIYNKK